MRMFLRKSVRPREPLAVAMSGVRMGERVLQIGIDDPALTGALAAKPGLSGHAAIAVGDEASAARARNAAAEAGALADVAVTPLDALPFQPESFDSVVIHSVDGLLASFDEEHRVRVAQACHRVLRKGGRVLVIEAGPRTGLAGLFRAGPKPSSAFEEGGGSAAVLKAAGFVAVRLLAAREGRSFTEGLKSS
ncbi:MAG TPA: class I SAM-dependent methyltransferase [Vicinamibacterales bacterium]|nr:class I SAM-dependent methyltransferase [Vicinamibacterales bacterium]